MRLNKYIASCINISRRNADELIKANKVNVNNKIINVLGTKIDENIDIVCIDGKPIHLVSVKMYIMLNKPSGYITSCKKEFGVDTVISIINTSQKIFPVGRLDKDTEGLLILTNDGDFANTLIHPKKSGTKIFKKYLVKIDKDITEDMKNKLENGVDIGGYITAKAIFEKVSNNSFYLSISEGKNRQIRKMCKMLNLNVLYLKRVSIGKLSLGNLEIGKYRDLTKEEIDYVLSIK